MLIFPQECESIAQRAPKAKGSMCGRVEISTFWSPMRIQELGDTEARSERTGAFHSLLCSLKLLLILQEMKQHLLLLTHFMEVLGTSPRSHRNKWVLLERANALPDTQTDAADGSFSSPVVFFEDNQSFMSEQQNQRWRIGFWELKGILGHSPSSSSSRGCMRARKQPQVFCYLFLVQPNEGESVTPHVPCPIPHHPSRSGGFIPLSAFLLKPSWFLLLCSLQDCSVLSTVSTWRKPSLIFYTKQPPTLSAFPHWQLSKKIFLFWTHFAFIPLCNTPASHLSKCLDTLRVCFLKQWPNIWGFWFVWFSCSPVKVSRERKT